LLTYYKVYQQNKLLGSYLGEYEGKWNFYDKNKWVSIYGDFLGVSDGLNAHIKEFKMENNPEVLAYLYGSICHYVIDSTVHPYVFYKTGNYIKKKKDTYKYKGKHGYLEYMIDAINYQNREQKTIYKTNLVNEVLPKLNFDKELKDILDYVFLNTYKISNYSKTIYRGYKNYRLCMKYFMYSRFGIKKTFYKLVDLTGLINTHLSSNCYFIKYLDMSVLNLEHNKWVYPTNKNKYYHYSFYDLYDIALIRANKLITLIDEFLLNENIEIKSVLKEIGNISYTTGVSLSCKQVMKYFQF